METDAQQRIMQLESINEELHRRILAMRKTIESQAMQLEAQDDQAWDLVSKFTKLLKGRD